MAGPVTVKVVEDPKHRLGGYAVVEMRGVAGFRGDGGFVLRRAGFAENYLTSSGWAIAETVLHPLKIEMQDDLVRLYLGPDLVGRLEVGMPVEIQLVGGPAGTTTWPDIAPLYEPDGARGRAVGALGRAVQAPSVLGPAARTLAAADRNREPSKAKIVVAQRTAAAPDNMGHQPIVSAPNPASAASQSGVSSDELSEPANRVGHHLRLRVVLAALFFVIVAICGGAYWWFYLRPTETTVEAKSVPPQQNEQAKPAEPKTTAPSVDHPATPASTPQQGSLQQLIAGKSPAQIAALAKDYFERGDYNNALPLYFEAAQQGDAPTMAAVAHMYDPTSFQPNKPFSKPNPRQAAKWYALAVAKGDQDAVEARGKLKDWLVEQSGKGDAEAAGILQEFWK